MKPHSTVSMDSLLPIILVMVQSVYGNASYVEGAADAEGSPPNFVFLLADDMGWNDTSLPIEPETRSPDSYLETPNIDRLAHQGMRFTDGYASHTICTPTRRSLLCGMTPARQRGTEFESEFEIPRHLTIPKMLHQVDSAYRCAHIGKWGEQMGCTPEEAGFDVSDGATTNANGNLNSLRPHAKAFAPVVKDDPKQSSALATRAIDFIQAQTNTGHPFYLQVSFYACHLGVEVRPKDLKRFSTKPGPSRDISPGYAAMLYDMDREIGRIIEALESRNLSGSTYVVFASDNGGQPNFQAGTDISPRNFPLAGGKQGLQEGGIRVPFIVTGPNVPASTVCRTPVVLYDLLPTFADLATRAVLMPSSVDGGSFADCFQGNCQDNIVRATPGLIFHRVKGKYGRPASVIRQGNYKLIKYWDTGSVHLYDLTNDLGESLDLAAQMPELAARLRDDMMAYLRSVDYEQYEQ